MPHRKITTLRFRHWPQRCQSPAMVLSSRVTSFHVAFARAPIAPYQVSQHVWSFSLLPSAPFINVVFGVRDSPSSHPHLIPGQFGSRKAPGSPHCVQDEFLVVQYSFYCPRSLQAQHLPTSVASPAVTAPPQHGWSSVAVINATFLPNVPWSNRFLKLHKHNLCTMINYLTENDALSQKLNTI